MSSRREHPTHTTGAHPAHRRAQRTGPHATPAGHPSSTGGSSTGARTVQQRPPTRYEPYLDGLFTYCLSVLCEHDAATAVLGDVLALAERRHNRRPVQCRPWLYALARWTCRQRLAEGQGAEEMPPLPEEVAGRRRRDLAALAWPEAAGTTPQQREALELAIRHRLSPQEVAAVLGMEGDEARELLASAACEVERTRAALVVVECGSCQALARLTDDTQVLLSAALRRELVRHVDECPECRRTAERATAGGPWPGSTNAPGTLPVLKAPREAAHAAMQQALHTRTGGPRARPRYDRRGFPVDSKDRAARIRLIRSRAMTTTVVATVVAAPVFALWAAYRGTPLGEGRETDSPSASERDADPGMDQYERTGNARSGPESRFSPGGHASDVSVDVIDRMRENEHGRSPSAGTQGPASRAPGRLTVDAQPGRDGTLITLTATGGSPVSWTARADVPWLRLSMTSGLLRPGEAVTFTVSVDHGREPEGPWSARVTVGPADTVVVIEGRGATGTPGPGTDPTPSPEDPTPTPTSEPTTSSPSASSSGSTAPPSGSGDPSPSG